MGSKQSTKNPEAESKKKSSRVGLKAIWVRSRESRGGPEEACAFLKNLLVEEYEQTKAVYDALDAEDQAAADEALGAELADAFKND